MVGDGHKMSVAAQIVQHVFGATEGTFQVDHPVLSKQRPQPGGKDLGLSEKFQISLNLVRPAERWVLHQLTWEAPQLTSQGLRP